tara:strand:+ start:3557 stop:4537 length:981 start_codon:yes stop_codon:yes gene_type:complete
MSTIVKIGVMGCANIARRSVIPAILANEKFELAAIASRTFSKAQEFGQLFKVKALEGYDSLFDENIDAIYIPLPTGLHEEWVSKAIKAGKHVLVEKSFGLSHTSTCRILSLAESRELVAMENFMFPFHNQHQEVMQMLSEGVIGSIRNFRATFSFPPLEEGNFRYQAEVGGGAILDAAAYTVKAAQVFLGKELQFLSASMHIDPVRKVDITGSAHLVYNNRIPVQLSWGFDNYYQCGVEVLGSKGKLTTNRTYTARDGFEPSAFVETASGLKEVKLPADDHFKKMLHGFYERIVKKQFKSSAAEIRQQSFLISEIQNKSIKGVYEA